MTPTVAEPIEPFDPRPLLDGEEDQCINCQYAIEWVQAEDMWKHTNTYSPYCYDYDEGLGYEFEGELKAWEASRD